MTGVINADTSEMQELRKAAVSAGAALHAAPTLLSALEAVELIIGVVMIGQRGNDGKGGATRFTADEWTPEVADAVERLSYIARCWAPLPEDTAT